MRLGIVTCGKCPALIPGEKPLLPIFQASGIEAAPVIWNDPSADWASFDALLVRSMWDYHLHTEAFVNWLTRVEHLNIPVWNPVDVLRWNHHKFYLRDLKQRGVAIAPTLFFRRNDPGALEQALRSGWSDVVIKPGISASSFRTHTFALNSDEARTRFEAAAAHGDYLVQPFLSAIQDHGEISLVFFNGEYSHAVLKRPRAGEFRVQAEHGGNETPYVPDGAVIQAGKVILEMARQPLLYARVDGILDKGRFVLMELELIEPDLFLETSTGSVNRFASALLSRLRPSASS